MALTHFKVIRVMGWRNFYATCTERGIYIIIRNNWNLAVDEWQE